MMKLDHLTILLRQAPGSVQPTGCALNPDGYLVRLWDERSMKEQ
ncbi:MAG TPA: hypothetical protein VLA62_04920 [Solirubrobacterales bacterium]|nr:hypothetical protein [Solirubrobacterales bacterium]